MLALAGFFGMGDPLDGDFPRLALGLGLGTRPFECLIVDG